MRYIVSGFSMEPTFHQGDRLWVSSIPYLFANPSHGEAVVLLHPFYKNKKILKRIEEVRSDATFMVRGDNPFESEDSRAFGAIKKHEILGRVLLRY